MTRAGLCPIGRKTRAYFAAVDRISGEVAVFDPSKDADFQLDAPPMPWIDLGWVGDFRRTSTSQIQEMKGGPSGTTVAQARAAVGARVELQFREWGKLQMALTGGTEHMNVLATDASASRAGSGGVPVAAVPLLEGSSDSELVVGAGAVDAFEIGDLVACDLDYAQQAGYVGTGIAAAYVIDAQQVRRDANYIRRVTFNVGRVALKTATSLLLGQRLPGGVPMAGAAVQRITAFVDREGGRFLQQWSGLFVEEEESGGRVCFYYPRLTPCTPNEVTEREQRVEIDHALGMLALRATFAALPTIDENDGAAVVCYRSYFPGERADAY